MEFCCWFRVAFSSPTYLVFSIYLPGELAVACVKGVLLSSCILAKQINMVFLVQTNYSKISTSELGNFYIFAFGKLSQYRHFISDIYIAMLQKWKLRQVLMKTGDLEKRSRVDRE